MRGGDCNSPASSSGESRELLEPCTNKCSGDAGGIFPYSPHLLCPCVGLLPDMCILLTAVFWCCSSCPLELQQETDGLVPGLQLGRSCSQMHIPLVLHKKIEVLSDFSSKDWKIMLGCSRVLPCAISAKKSGI